MHQGIVRTALMGLLAFTQTGVAGEAESSAHDWGANVAIVTDYLFRGASRSNEDLAVQGGFDYAHEDSGFFAGAWASSTEFNTGASDGASAEVDLFGGFTGSFANDVGWKIGSRYYLFPDQNIDRLAGDFEMLEIEGGLNYTFDSLYSPNAQIGIAYSPDYFGEDGDGVYVSGGIDFALPRNFGLYARLGYLDVEGDETFPGGYDYTHYSIGLTRNVAIFTLDLSWNDADDECEVIAGDNYCEAVLFRIASHW